MTTYWHIIRCMSGQEGKTERYLENMGYPHGWHPTEKVRISESIWQRMARATKGKMPKRYKVKPYVHGYVFVPAGEINIDRIKRNPFGAWMDPLVVNDAPYRLTDAAMSQMRQAPERIKELLDEIEQAKREEWEAKRPKVGERAKVMAGVFEGHEALVDSVSGGVVTFAGEGILGKIRVAETMVERAA